MPQRTYPNLFAYLSHAGETQTELARELGISVAHLSLIKWGDRQPRLALALRIADLCNVPLESLIQGRPARKAS